MPKKNAVQTSFSFVSPPSSLSHRTRTKGNKKTTPGRNAVLPENSEDDLQWRLPLEGVPEENARKLLEKRVSAHMKGSLELVITDNRYSIITVKRKGSHFRLRVHHMFLHANVEVVRALARYVEKSDSKSSETLNDFIDRNQDKIKAADPKLARRPKLTTKGKYYDIQKIFDKLNDLFFEGALRIDITWGRSPKRSSRNSMKKHRSIKMGSYSVEDRLIRIHPALDRKFVPDYFIESVIYHEMLHHVHPIPVKGGRRQFHTDEFKAQERTFPLYEKAKKWERSNIDRLLLF